MNFTSKNSRFDAIRETEQPKQREERGKEKRHKKDNSSKHKIKRSHDEKSYSKKKTLEHKTVNLPPPPVTFDHYPTLGESSVSKEPQQDTVNSCVPKQETAWKDLIAKREEEENEAPIDPIQPGWIRLRMDKKTHKIIREYGPPVEDSGWFEKWQEHERMLKHRRWLAYIEEQEEIRRELEPEYLYQREDFSEPEYDSDSEDILVEEECSSEEADSDADY